MNSIKSVPIMRLKIFFFTALILMTSVSSSYSQDDTLKLTLGDALMIARAQSADAMIAKHRFRMNYWEYRSFKADYLPSLTLDADLPGFSRSYQKITVTDGPVQYQLNTEGNYFAGLTMTQKLGATGGSLYLRSDLSRLDNFYEDSISSSYHSTPIVIGYVQPLFKFNEYRWAKQLEPLKYEKAKRQYLEDIEQVSITTISHFFNLLSAQIEMGIARKNLNSYDTLYKIAKGRYQLGKIAENDLLQLELNYLKAKAAVDNASLNYEDMLFRLTSFLRLKDVKTIRLQPPAETRHDVVSSAEAVAESRKNTAESLNFQERLLSAESTVRMEKMNGRFDADLSMEFGLEQNTRSLSTVYQDPGDRELLNLSVNIPILDWGRARGQIKVAESNLELEQTSVEQEILDFEQNVFLSVMEFNMQENQLYIAAKADTVAQKRYDVTQKRYMIGQVNDVLELNNAQIDNDNARMGYYSALRNYWINYYQLRKLTLYDFIDDKMLIFDIREIM
jgi:outer membrane protein TolC